MRPRLKPVLLQIDDRRVPLLGQSRGEKPRDHHLRVVILQLHVCGQLQIFRLEIVVQKMRHQHFQSETAGVDVFRFRPFSDIFQQLRLVPDKRLRRQAVADRPVVDIRQKRLDRSHAHAVILHLRKQYTVQDVFVVVRMRQFCQKGAHLLCSGDFLRQLPHHRHAHADDRFLRDIRNQRALKPRIPLISERKEPFPDVRSPAHPRLCASIAFI